MNDCFNLTAKAYDTFGTGTLSGSVMITVAENAPSVQITSPANNAKYQLPVSLQLQASATDQDGTIASVSPPFLAITSSEATRGGRYNPPFQF